MKKLNKLFYLALVALGLLTYSCTKEGPAGPAGADGTNGTDVTSLCLQCHTDANMNTIEAQYDESVHATGTAFESSHVRDGKECARCHISEGFIETVHTGMDTTADVVPIPTRISCVTCHSGLHKSFDVANDGSDYALRITGPVKMLVFSDSLDLGDASNTCAYCHQPRTGAPVANVGVDSFKVTSPYYGAHHGPQSTVLAGISGYTFGGKVKNTEVHVSAGATCVVCHMNEGSHTWEPSVDACKACHGNDVTDFDKGGDIDGLQTEIEGLMSNLETALQGKGILNASGAIVLGTYTVDQAGALYNYEMIKDDRSSGVHNYPYIKALLNASIDALK